jgi:hypothetical protein
MESSDASIPPLHEQAVKAAELLTDPGHLSPEFIEARENFWTTVGDSRVFIGCGDDRAPTEASTEALMVGRDATLMSPAEGYASVYGATAGLAKNVLVTGIAQFGNEFFDAIDGFDGAMALLLNNSNYPQTLHSAESNEQNSRHFVFDNAAPVGCAYAAGVGATAALLIGSSSATRDIAKLDQQYVFNSTDGFDDLLRGQDVFLKRTIDPTTREYFAVNRERYGRYHTKFGDRLDIMVLGRTHTEAEGTGVISNFSLEQVGNPTKAHENQLDFYRLDIAMATDIVLRVLSKPLAAINPRYVLSPDLLMRSLQIDSTPVRAVLASQDKNPKLNGVTDARNLKMGFRGDADESLHILEDRQASGYYRRAA